MSDSIYCPANQSTKIFYCNYFGLYQKYKISVDIDEKVTAKKWYNGIPYSWTFTSYTYFYAYPGYTSVYLTPPSNCYATITNVT